MSGGQVRFAIPLARHPKIAPQTLEAARKGGRPEAVV
jgi:hypothetical protein